MDVYAGPLRDEPLAIELYNTSYAAGGVAVDGLATRRSTDAWLHGLADRLPAGGSRTIVRPAGLVHLRSAVRQALEAAVEDSEPPALAVEQLNATSARAPGFPTARRRGDQGLVKELDVGEATHEDVVLAALAADAIELITGTRRSDIRACGAPGCVLLYVKGHPRQEWCSAACGNRARQARHYRRSRA